VKRSLGIPRIDARSPQTEYAAFLYDAPPLGHEFLGAAKIVFGIHFSNAQGAKNRRRIHLTYSSKPSKRPNSVTRPAICPRNSRRSFGLIGLDATSAQPSRMLAVKL
jgi:hypothetical protein